MRGEVSRVTSNWHGNYVSDRDIDVKLFIGKKIKALKTTKRGQFLKKAKTLMKTLTAACLYGVLQIAQYAALLTEQK